MGYTESLENMIFEFLPEDDYEDTPVEKILDYLNQEDSFRSFGEGLESMVRKYMPEQYDLTPKDYLKEKANAAGISFNRNTLNNWFDGNRPKKGEKSREHMYMVSFAIGMDIHDTCELFQKVYMDRPFDFRNITEFIYYYCIRNKFDYTHAQNLLGRVILVEEEERTIATQLLQSESEKIDTDDELIHYINSHPHNFRLNNKNAKMVLEKLLKKVRVSEEDKELYRDKKINLNCEKCSYIIREICKSEEYNSGSEDRIVDKNKSLTSIETMLDIITSGVTRGKEGIKTGQSIFKESRLPQEIISRFPQKQTFSKEEPTYEELRKMIILLKSYETWFRMEYLEEEMDLDEYIEELNSILFDCSLQCLYYGNPFDWLFMYCSAVDGTEGPLETFRSILLDARQSE